MLNLYTHFEAAVHTWRKKFSCSALDCHGSRRNWWRPSDKPASMQLHGFRYCFPECFERELQRRIIELQLGLSRSAKPPYRLPLGLLMLSRGDLNRDQLRSALEAQRQNAGGNIGEWIQRLGFASENQVTAALAAQWSCPVLKSLPAAAAQCEIPFQLLQHFQMVPVHYNRQMQVVHLAFATRINYRLLLAIEQMLECKAEPCLANAAAVEGMLTRMEEGSRGCNQALEAVNGPAEMTRVASSYALRLAAEKVRVVGCGEYVWIKVQGEKNKVNLLLRQPADETVLGGDLMIKR